MIISDLYQTNITCSTYNTTIDSGNGSTTITVTVKLEDFNKNAVSGKSVTLTVDKGYFKSVTGTSTTNYSNTTTKSVSATTKSDGTITTVYVPSEWGLATFSANNTKIQIKSSGWKSVATGANYATLYVNEEMRLCYLKIYYENYTVKSSHGYNQWGTKIIPDAYSAQGIEGICAYSTSIVVESSGHIGIRDWGIAGNNFSTNLNAVFVWKY